MRLTLIIFLLPLFCLSQKLFVDNSKVSFFSWAPLEDITAVSNKMEGVVDFETGDFFFRIPISTFIFPSSLMQKHFNEKYMETEKYTFSSFKGSFNESIPASLSDSLTVNAKGVLNIHGVSKNVIIQTNILVNNTQVQFSSFFNVRLVDYKIKVPKIVRMNIADTIEVNVSGTLISN